MLDSQQRDAVVNRGAFDSQQRDAVVNRGRSIHNRETPLLTGSVRFTTERRRCKSNLQKQQKAHPNSIRMRFSILKHQFFPAAQFICDFVEFSQTVVDS